MKALIERNAKALVLLVIIAAAVTADVFGVEVGLETEHYVALLVADALVWAVPNKDN